MSFLKHYYVFFPCKFLLWFRHIKVIRHCYWASVWWCPVGVFLCGSIQRKLFFYVVHNYLILWLNSHMKSAFNFSSFPHEAKHPRARCWGCFTDLSLADWWLEQSSVKLCALLLCLLTVPVVCLRHCLSLLNHCSLNSVPPVTETLSPGLRGLITQTRTLYFAPKCSVWHKHMRADRMRVQEIERFI